MYATCPQNMPPLRRNTECGRPLAMSHSFSGTYYPSPTEAAAIEQLQADSLAAELKQVDDLLAAHIEPHQPMRLIVGSASMTQRISEHLAKMQVDDIEVQVAGSLLEPHYYKTKEADYWTPAMAEAKAAAWDAQQPRHSSQFTKSQPSTKARKQARKRAKAGRKANR